MVNLFTQRKGQSAIEYLTTYGWMLLVIAIVGGAIFTTIQNRSTIQTTSGFQNTDVKITNFGITANDAGEEDLQLELRATAQEQVEKVNITLAQKQTDKVEYLETDSDLISAIPVGKTKTVNLENFSSTEVTNEFNVTITYDSGGLTNLKAEGTMQGQFKIGS